MALSDVMKFIIHTGQFVIPTQSFNTSKDLDLWYRPLLLAVSWVGSGYNWATNTRQSLTVFYMYCTGLICVHDTWQPLSMWHQNSIDWKILTTEGCEGWWSLSGHSSMTRALAGTSLVPRLLCVGGQEPGNKTSRDPGTGFFTLLYFTSYLPSN